MDQHYPFFMTHSIHKSSSSALASFLDEAIIHQSTSLFTLITQHHLNDWKGCRRDLFFHVDISEKLFWHVDDMSTYTTTSVRFSVVLSYIVNLPCLLPGEVIDTIDSLIFIAQIKGRNILQTRKYSAHCDCSIKNGQHYVTIAVSLQNFDIILLLLRYLEYRLIGITCRYMSWNILYANIGMFFSCRWHVAIISCQRQP